MRRTDAGKCVLSLRKLLFGRRSSRKALGVFRSASEWSCEAPYARVRTMAISVIDTLEIPVEDRIRLVAEIWESIAEVPDAIQLTEETRQLLARRMEAHRANPTAGSPWSEVRQRILSK